MRFLIYVSFCLSLASAATAQSVPSDTQALVPLENGYFLDVIPAKYITVSKSKVDVEDQPLEWVTIPAVFETITETEIVQDGYTDLNITPAIFAQDGSVVETAKLAMKEVPAIRKQVSRRVVKIPARRVQRQAAPLCNLPQIRRELVTPKTYVLYDTAQVELARYENAAELMAAIHTD